MPIEPAEEERHVRLPDAEPQVARVRELRVAVELVDLVLVERLQRLVLVAAELEDRVLDEVAAGRVVVEQREADRVAVGAVAAALAAGVVRDRRRVAGQRPVRGRPAELGAGEVVEHRTADVGFDVTEGRVAAALHGGVDLAGADVADGGVARAGAELEVRDAVERERVHELVGERVGVVDAFELEAFVVLAAAAENRVAAAVERGARQRDDQVRLALSVRLAQDRLDLVRVDAVGVLRLLRLERADARGAARGRADRLELGGQRLVDRGRLRRADGDAVDGRTLIARCGERDAVRVGDDADDAEEALGVCLRGVPGRRRDGDDVDVRRLAGRWP